MQWICIDALHAAHCYKRHTRVLCWWHFQAGGFWTASAAAGTAGTACLCSFLLKGVAYVFELSSSELLCLCMQARSLCYSVHDALAASAAAAHTVMVSCMCPLWGPDSLCVEPFLCITLYSAGWRACFASAGWHSLCFGVCIWCRAELHAVQTLLFTALDCGWVPVLAAVQACCVCCQHVTPEHGICAG